MEQYTGWSFVFIFDKIFGSAGADIMRQKWDQCGF